jgi:mRNA interferase HigB
MELINHAEIERFLAKHTDAMEWFASFVPVVEGAEWRNLMEVRAAYPHADAVLFKKTKVTITIFNVKGNEYRLLSVINYVRQTFYVWKIMSHAEYDKNKWKRSL